MKRLKIKLFVVTFIMGGLFSVQAQAPYKHGIGATAGTLDAVSYKMFFSDNLALQADLGYKYIVTAGQHDMKNIAVQSLELNPNFMYERNITKGFYLLGGGGISLGYSWTFFYDGWSYRFNYGKFGINAIIGGEYKLNIPLTIQVDFRPGYGLLFAKQNNTWNYFDWNLCASVRYTF